MDALQGIVLGIIQGALEWIPVSSEGQSMLAMIHWLGISPSAALSYSIFLHLGTMSAVLVRFRHEFLNMIREINSTLAKTVIISTLATGVTGLPLYFLFKESFSGGREATILIAVLLMATGLLLRYRGSGEREAEDMTLGDMIALGLAQGLAILPGVSRSGTTLTVLLMKGFKQDDALSVSFIISVPAVLGAIVLDHSLVAISPATAAAMLIASFTTGYLAMDLLIRFAKTINFSGFCLAMGMITLILALGM